MTYRNASLSHRLRAQGAALTAADEAAGNVLRASAESTLVQLGVAADAAPSVSALEIERWYDAVSHPPSTAALANHIATVIGSRDDVGAIVELRNAVPEMDMLTMRAVATHLDHAATASKTIQTKLSDSGYTATQIQAALFAPSAVQHVESPTRAPLTDDFTSMMTVVDANRLYHAMRSFATAQETIEASQGRRVATAAVETSDAFRATHLPSHQRGVLASNFADVVDIVESELKVLATSQQQLMLYHIAPMQILRDVVAGASMVGYPTSPFELLPATEGKIEDLQEHIRTHRIAWVASLGILFGPIIGVLAYFGIRKMRVNTIAEETLEVISAADMAKLTNGIKQAVDALKDVSQKVTPDASPEALRQIRANITRNVAALNLGIAVDKRGVLQLVDTLPEVESATVQAHGYTGEMLGRASSAIRNIAQYSKQSARAYDSLGKLVSGLRRKPENDTTSDDAIREAQELTHTVDTLARAIARASRLITNTTTTLNRAMRAHETTNSGAEGAIEDSGAGDTLTVFERFWKWSNEQHHKHPILFMFMPFFGQIALLNSLATILERSLAVNHVAARQLLNIWYLDTQTILPFRDLQRLSTITGMGRTAVQEIIRYIDMVIARGLYSDPQDISVVVRGIRDVLGRHGLHRWTTVRFPKATTPTAGTMKDIFVPGKVDLPNFISETPSNAGYRNDWRLEGGFLVKLGGIKKQALENKKIAEELVALSARYANNADLRWVVARSAIDSIAKTIGPLQQLIDQNWKNIIQNLQRHHDRLRPDDNSKAVYED